MTRDQVLTRAANIDLIQDPGFQSFVDGVVKVAETMPEPQLWEPGSVDAVTAAAAAEASLRPRSQTVPFAGVVWEDLSIEERAKIASDISDPLAHIRKILIASGCDQAINATDQELESLYDISIENGSLDGM